MNLAAGCIRGAVKSDRLRASSFGFGLLGWGILAAGRGAFLAGQAGILGLGGRRGTLGLPTRLHRAPGLVSSGRVVLSPAQDPDRALLGGEAPTLGRGSRCSSQLRWRRDRRGEAARTGGQHRHRGGLHDRHQRTREKAEEDGDQRTDRDRNLDRTGSARPSLAPRRARGGTSP